MNNKNPYDEQHTLKDSLIDLWIIVMKRKWIVMSFALCVMVIVTIISFLQKPIYTSKGTLLIEKEPNILAFDQIFQVDTFNNDYYQTHYKMLVSRTLAYDTIMRLRLYENEKFTNSPCAESIPPDKLDPFFKEKLIDNFLDRLSVRPITNRLVEVGFRDSDPKFAADTLNALLNAYIDLNIEKKFQATERAAEFLNNQIASVRTEIDNKERELQEYGAEKNIIILNDKETTIVENLKGLNQALSEAQIDRIKKETFYNEIKDAQWNDIPESLNNEILNKLRQEYDRLNREYIMKSKSFEDDFPEMQKLKVELDTIRESLDNETKNLIKAAYSDYIGALKRERSFEGAFNEQKQEAIKLNSNAILYNSLQIEISNKKDVLASLLKRQSETDVSLRLNRLRTSNISILESATLPFNPSSPKKRRNMVLAFMFGIFGGLGLAFLFEFLDNSVKNFRDVQKCSGLPVLGFIPAFSANGKQKFFHKYRSKKKKESKHQEVDLKSIELITKHMPKSKISENYRAIRTTLFLSSEDSGLKTVGISSSLPQEGKTTTLSNLAVSFAEIGNKVLIIDADLRKPKQHRIFKINNIDGLTDYLKGDVELDKIIKNTWIPNINLINSGPLPVKPLELLGSEKMASLIEFAKRHFECILFDCPPVLLVSDVILLGSKLDGMILVTWGGKTSQDALRRAKEKLDIHKIKCPGVIINSADLKEHDYYYMRHYYHYYE